MGDSWEVRRPRWSFRGVSLLIDARREARGMVNYYGSGVKDMDIGTVKWFNSTKGFGFIQPDNGGPDAFVHISAVERAGLRDLQEGQKLTYELVADRKSGKMSADHLKAIG